MDDFNVSALHESKNEWGARLVTLLTPLVIDGYKSILEESITLCKDNNEMDKYLMTFQNLISRIPKWNQQIVENERKRICEKSRCNYLEDLVTCVHILQLKTLTAMRAGQKQKKIDINVPKLDDFIHKIYINIARKVYKNVYLFQVGIEPLQIQKNHRELEIIVQECILNTLRESIPVEAILKAYMDESIEEDVIEDIKEEVTHEPIIIPVETKDNSPIVETKDNSTIVETKDNSTIVETKDNSAIVEEPQNSSISFSDVDYIKTDNGVSQIIAPKNIDRLEEISVMRNEQRKRESEDDYDNVKLTISDEDFNLDNLDIHNIEEPKLELLPDLLIDEIEILE